MSLINLKEIIRAFETNGLQRWAVLLTDQVSKILNDDHHGDLKKWMDAIEQLPHVEASINGLTDSAVSGGSLLSDDDKKKAISLLMQIHPWRKGPYLLSGIELDTEWRSDLKWQRLLPHISSLKNRTILDVGCGNGYHCWRMAGEGADLVVGIDPSKMFMAQHKAISHFMGDAAPVHLLPLKSEDIPANLQLFDTVFSMGILYHRRSPIDHLMELKGALKVGGELVLETLVIEGDDQQVLVPGERYAKMRNVWFIPSVKHLMGWLRRCGFKNIREVDTTITTAEEQRATDWMMFDSLDTFLDSNDKSKTVEGYPAPLRTVIVATK